MEFENPKLFVGGITVEADEANLREYFSKFGEVNHVYVNSVKHIAFVNFSDPLMARNALQQEEHIIFGRKVDVKPAKPRTHISNRKVFVGGLPLDITEETFTEYFGSFGTIIDAVIIPDKESGRYRGFGFVTYDSEEAASNVLRQSFHRLNNKIVEVKRAEPREKMSRTWDRRDSPPAAVEMNNIYNVNNQPQPSIPGGYVYDYSTGYHVYDYGTGYHVYDYNTGSSVWVPVTNGYAPMYQSHNQVYYHPNSNPWQRPMY